MNAARTAAALRLCVFVTLAIAACDDAPAPIDAAIDAPIVDAATDAPTVDVPAADAPDAAPAGGWTLRWSDEFDGPDGAGVDPTRWVYETGGGGWGNGESQNYTARTDNVVRRGGNLEIIALRESFEGSSFTSGRIKTAGRFEFTYGRVEMRARLPEGGPGIWPAFWLLGANIGAVSWPACGEIDIMEWVGVAPTRVFGTLHGPRYSGAGSVGAWHAEAAPYSAGFHVYAVEWEPDAIRWYFDDRLFELRTPLDLAGRAWAFDHDFFILLNLAVGGAWPGPADATTPFPQRYLIDYVRVYQRPAPTPSPRAVYTLRASLNGSYVAADSYDGDRLVANRAAASTWERYEVQDLGGGRSALRSLMNYKYVSAGPTGADTLTANAEAVGPGEAFTLVTNPDGTRALRCAANDRYVSVPTADPRRLAATATAVGAAESFTVAPVAP